MTRPTHRHRRSSGISLVLTLAVLGMFALGALAGCGDSSNDSSGGGAAGSGAATATTTARQGEVRDKGAHVMPFSLDDTSHAFVELPDGGDQTVVASDPTDTEQIGLIRDHFRSIAAAFAEGDFSAPAAIHGHDMPGLAVLSARPDAFTVTYEEVPAGALIHYRSSDPEVRSALAAWFAAQLADHGPDASDHNP